MGPAIGTRTTTRSLPIRRSQPEKILSGGNVVVEHSGSRESEQLDRLG